MKQFLRTISYLRLRHFLNAAIDMYKTMRINANKKLQKHIALVLNFSILINEK